MILIYDYFCEKWYQHPNFKGKVFDSKTDWYWKNVLVQLIVVSHFYVVFNNSVFNKSNGARTSCNVPITGLKILDSRHNKFRW